MAEAPTGPTDPAAGRPGPGRSDDTHIIGMAPVAEAAGGGGDDYATEELEYLFGREPDEDPLPKIDPAELAGLAGGGPGQSTGIRRVLPREDHPGGLVARYLFPPEGYRGGWRRDLIYLARPLAIGVLSALGLGWLAGSLVQWGAWT